MIGSKLGHYEILEQIGAGGMGVVYRARDQRLDRTVAIKVLPPGLLSDEEARRRFRDEALALARINHPNIATLYDTGSEGETDFLVMEDIPGSSLEERIQLGPLPAREVIALGIQIAEGLNSAHERGVIHRDLKPGNVRLTLDGRAKILDFGLARRAPQPSLLGTTATVTDLHETSGTIPYMSPEQLQGRPADARSDIWAFGAVLYELACGKRPFPGNVPTAIAADIIHKQPQPPRSQRPDIPFALEKIILKCLQKDPSQRYVSARAVLQDLQELQSPRTTSPLTPVQPATPSELPPMEIAHVLFMDIVSYSTLPMDEQESNLRRLQEIVLSNSEFAAAQSEDRLIRLPTGDGMALVFFGDSQAPARCAIEVGRSLRKETSLKLRMGINSGPVYRIADINASNNVAGAGINMAQRVMDCGDAGHILVSQSNAEVLAQVSHWRSALHDLGEAKVKHDVRIRVFNLYQDDAGNPSVPRQLRAATTRRTAAWVGSVAAIMLLAVGAWLVVRFVLPRFTGPGWIERRSVAVLGFKNLTGDPAEEWMSTALAEMLTTELAAGEQLRAISGEDVASAKRDLNLPDTASLGAATLGQVRKRLGSDLVVVGSYVDVNSQVRLDMQLQDAASGRTIANLKETGTESGLLDLVNRAGASLRRSCGIRNLSAAESASVRAASPSTVEAARIYAEGLDRLREFDATGARDKFEAAIAADPKNALFHSSLSSAWAQLGYDAKALSEAQRAFNLSSGLSREDRLATEGAFRVAGKQWNEAIDVYHTLFGFFPDNLDYGLALADVQVSGGKAQAALDTIGKMRQSMKPEDTDPRIDLAEARAASALADYRRTLNSARQAATGAQRQGARIERGHALLQQCSALRRLGQLDDAKRLGQEAATVFAERRYLRGEARSLTCVASALQDQGDLKSAQPMFEKALVLVQSIGARVEIAGALNNLGVLLAGLGKLEESTEKYRQAASVAAEIGDQVDQQIAESNVGSNLISLGRFRSARPPTQNSLQAARAIGDKRGETESLINLAVISYSLGELDQAEKQSNDSIAASRSLGLAADTAYALGVVGDIQLAKDDLFAAEKSYRESLDIRQKVGDKRGAAASQLAFAALWLERGDAVQATSLATDAAHQLHEAQDSDQEASAHNLLARAALAQKKLDVASSQLQAASNLAPSDETVKLALTITAGEISAAGGKPSDARRQLASAQTRANEMEYVPGKLQAGLALAEIAARSGQPQALQSLVQEASKAGFRLIARRARELSSNANSRR